jgi:hypothetical protein
MVWVYYSAQIFLYGAEFTWVYAHELGSRRGETRPPPVEELIAAAPMPEIKPVETPVPAPQPRRTSRFEVGVAAAFLTGGALGFWNARREAPPQRGSILRRWRLTDR